MKIKAASIAASFGSLNKVDRKILYASASVPANLVMFIWKVGVLFIAPSLGIIANAIYTLGVGGAKVLAVRAHTASRSHTRAQRYDDAELQQRRIYRLIGLIILVLSVLYVGASLLGLAMGEAEGRYKRWVAMTIAGLAFTELGFSIAGVIWARRNRELIIEAIRLANLAGSLILIALAERALLSLSNPDGSALYGTLGGVFLGTAAAAIGLTMLLRPLPPPNKQDRQPMSPQTMHHPSNPHESYPTRRQ